MNMFSLLKLYSYIYIYIKLKYYLIKQNKKVDKICNTV